MSATRFVIVSHPRCGSHMVASSLEQRGDVSCDCEPFSITKFPFGRQPKLDQMLPKIFDPQLMQTKSGVGFIIHRFRQGYAGMPGYGVWDWIREVKLPVILLGRYNHVRRFVSNRLADITRVWIRYKGQSSKPNSPKTRVTLNVPSLLKDVSTYTRLWNEMRERFSSQPVLELHYEDIIADPCATLIGVQQWLGLPDPRYVPPATLKQEQRPLHETLKNYNDACRQLAGTPYEQFLLDDRTHEMAVPNHAPGTQTQIKEDGPGVNRVHPVA